MILSFNDYRSMLNLNSIYMKKFLFIVVLIFLSIFADAQIPRNIFGQSLGVTTMNQAETFFSNEGKDILVREDDDTCFKLEDVSFDGLTWPTAAFFFYNDKLNAIYLSDTEEYTPREKLNMKWKELYNSYMTKYHNFMVESETNEEQLLFVDGKTQIVATYIDYGEYKGIALMYSDLDIKRREYFNSIND